MTRIVPLTQPVTNFSIFGSNGPNEYMEFYAINQYISKEALEGARDQGISLFLNHECPKVVEYKQNVFSCDVGGVVLLSDAASRLQLAKLQRLGKERLYPSWVALSCVLNEPRQRLDIRQAWFLDEADAVQFSLKYQAERQKVSGTV